MQVSGNHAAGGIAELAASAPETPSYASDAARLRAVGFSRRARAALVDNRLRTQADESTIAGEHGVSTSGVKGQWQVITAL